MISARFHAAHFVALLAAVLLTAAQYLILDYDAQLRVSGYQAAASALTATG